MLVAAHQRVSRTERRKFLASMVLGDKAVSLDKSLVTMFRNVGLSHVLAASGFNLTVVMVMTFFVGRLIILLPLQFIHCALPPCAVMCLLQVHHNR